MNNRIEAIYQIDAYRPGIKAAKSLWSAWLEALKAMLGCLGPNMMAMVVKGTASANITDSRAIFGMDIGFYMGSIPHTLYLAEIRGI